MDKYYRKEVKKFISIFIVTCILFTAGNSYAKSNPSDISLSALWNRVFDSTNNGIKAVITGSATLTGLTVDGVIYILEQADASADSAGYGQIWVNTATPNELWFTDDAGTDVQLGVGGATAYDDIGDPDANSNIDFTSYTNTWTSSTSALNMTYSSVAGQNVSILLDSGNHCEIIIDKAAANDNGLIYFKTGGAFKYFIGSSLTDLIQFQQFADIDAGDAFTFNTAATAELIGSSGTQVFLAVTPEIAQSGTAAYTAFEVDVTETSTGSGTKLLADFQVGGTSKFNVDNTGIVDFAGATRTASTVTHDAYVTLKIGGVAYKFMLGS